eukprot:m.20313 g.20313  ORF g.20313 m.20313 type:complete len:189 (+) comp5238_c0_seq2:72-638(+)
MTLTVMMLLRRCVGAQRLPSIMRTVWMSNPLECVKKELHSCIPQTMGVDIEVNVLDDPANSHLRIRKFSSKGFTINNIFHEGPMMILGSLHLEWNVKSVKELTVDSLVPLELYHPRPEILVVGSGDDVVHISDDIKQYVSQLGIALEVQDTRHACSTYNFLVEEGRDVAAVLLPPVSFVPEKMSRSKG